MFKPKALIAPLLALTLLTPLMMPSHVAAQAGTAARTAREESPQEHEKGLLDVEYNTAIWVVIIFTVLLVVLYKMAWKNVLVGLKSREERIRGDIASAEAARAKAEASLKDYAAQLATAEGKARDIINEAILQAQRIADQNRTRAQEEAEQIKERALKDIEEARKQAVSDIYDQAATLSTSIAEKILRRNLNVDDQRDLVTRSLDQIGSVARN